jgi:hypothetical protein
VISLPAILLRVATTLQNLFLKQQFLLCCPVKHQYGTEMSNDASRMPMFILPALSYNLYALISRPISRYYLGICLKDLRKIPEVIH